VKVDPTRREEDWTALGLHRSSKPPNRFLCAHTVQKRRSWLDPERRQFDRWRDPHDAVSVSKVVAVLPEAMVLDTELGVTYRDGYLLLGFVGFLTGSLQNPEKPARNLSPARAVEGVDSRRQFDQPPSTRIAASVNYKPVTRNSTSISPSTWDDAPPSYQPTANTPWRRW